MMDAPRSASSRCATRGLRVALAVLVILAAASGLVVRPADAKPRGFDTPDEAVTALVAAIRAGDGRALRDILGPAGSALIASGDPVADRNQAQAFVAAYDRGHRLEGGGGKVTLYLGPDDFPFPIPLVPAGVVWRFDTRAGKEEILNRRIGRNELSAIQVCLAYVDAQREYYAEARSADGLREYAQRFASTRGKRDGLYWETTPAQAPSPMGPFVARARSEGYTVKRARPVPYHGYYYRILTGQGPNARSGAYSYVAHGRMIGGFALVAFPARYGVSGVMTFIVNHDGVVYEKDLGPHTAAIARTMKVFDPGATWRKA